MKSVLQSIVSEHMGLLEVLREVEEGIENGQNFSELSGSLSCLEKELESHLRHEDNEFYPHLKELAADNFELQNALLILESDIMAVAEGCMVFFSKAASGEINPGEFKAFSSALKNRIAKEENVLMPFIK